MNTATWLKSMVKKGEQIGRTIGFPTVNLDPGLLSSEIKRGVYAANIRIRRKDYSGALYFGPRLVRNETHDVLEIHVFDFDEMIYGETISFQLRNFLHPPKHLSSLEELKTQLVADCEAVKKLLQ